MKQWSEDVEMMNRESSSIHDNLKKLYAEKSFEVSEVATKILCRYAA